MGTLVVLAVAALCGLVAGTAMVSYRRRNPSWLSAAPDTRPRPMTPVEQQRFQYADACAARATYFAMHGQHIESMRYWLLASEATVTPEGQLACLDNALEEYRQIGVWRVH